jgi:hypothetical protein
MPVRPWEMDRLTPDEEARIVEHHRGPQQEPETLTDAVRRGW